MKSNVRTDKHSSKKEPDALDFEIKVSRLFLPSDQSFLDSFGIPVHSFKCSSSRHTQRYTKGGGP